MRSRLLLAASLTACVFIAASCTDAGNAGVTLRTSNASTGATPGSTDGSSPGGTPPDGTDGPTGGDGDPFGWTDYSSGDDTLQVGHLEVPVDYDDPSGATFDLYVTRHQASDPGERIGSLLVNPGGPGFPGSDFAIYADSTYSKYLVDHFDIVAWDPRGTGQSTPFIDCIDDYDQYFAVADVTPDDDEERQQIVDLAKEFQGECVSKNADILQHVGTNDSARDMDSIRQALGEDTISYFGFSYGSELGATWATLFPDTVRAAVLDGAADPNADLLTEGLQQTKGFEDSLDNFLQNCSDETACPFNHDGDAASAFDALMEGLDAEPVPTEPGRPDVTRGVALSAVTQAMYSQSYWPDLAQALADAEDGDGRGLLTLYDTYFQRRNDGTYDNSLEAFQVILCMDVVDRPTVAEDDATAAQFTEIAPRLAPEGSTGSYFCSFFPEPDAPRVPITGAGAGPILVVGTTGDPATPLASSENMANDLEDGTLLTVVADQHTGYGVNQCSLDAVDHYLVDLNVPDPGTRCG